MLDIWRTIYYLVINMVYNLISLLLDSKSKLVVKSEDSVEYMYNILDSGDY